MCSKGYWLTIQFFVAIVFHINPWGTVRKYHYRYMTFSEYIPLAQVVPGPVEPYSAESWPKTPIISFPNKAPGYYIENNGFSFGFSLLFILILMVCVLFFFLSPLFSTALYRRNFQYIERQNILPVSGKVFFGLDLSVVVLHASTRCICCM